MKANSPVTNIMSTNVHSIDISSDLHEARRVLEKNHIRHLPVVEGSKLKGILSLTDLNRLGFADQFGNGEEEVDEAIYEMLSIGQVMSHHPKTVASSSTIKDVAEILSKSEYHALPVVDKDKLVGIVTTTDVINYMLEELNNN